MDSKSALNPRQLMILTILKRWSWRCSYFVWLCVFYYGSFHVEACLVLCPRAFSVLFTIVITSLGEETAGLYASRTFVCLSCVCYFLLFSSSWCQGLGEVCDCETPCLFFVYIFLSMTK